MESRVTLQFFESSFVSEQYDSVLIVAVFGEADDEGVYIVEEFLLPSLS